MATGSLIPDRSIKDCELWCGDVRECLEQLPENSVHCVITSPPYWNQRSYLPKDHPNKSKEIGSEIESSYFVQSAAEVFQEVKRVLRNDGVLYLNLGDSFYRKQLLGIPWRVAFSLQTCGWILRSAMPWIKRDILPGSAPDRPISALEYVFLFTKNVQYFFDKEAVRTKTGNESSWKEYLESDGRRHFHESDKEKGMLQYNPNFKPMNHPEGRPIRDTDFWIQSVKSPYGLVGADEELLGIDVTSESSGLDHFASFPSKFVTPLMLSGTSAKGCCPNCGSPWIRILKKKRMPTRSGKNTKIKDKPEEEIGNRDPERHVTLTETTGWKPSCSCDTKDNIAPCTVLDPFCGVCTTGLVAIRNNRRFIGIDLNPKSIKIGKEVLKSRSKKIIKQEKVGLEAFL